MAITKKTEFIVDRRFDLQSCKHYTNDSVTVMHCHHYATLYTQLADDAELFDGKSMLRDTAEHTFYNLLLKYMADHGVDCLDDKISIAEEYWAFIGMGSLKIVQAGDVCGRVEMSRSHVDEGWIKKWGNRSEPVNFITQGYLSAAFAVLFNAPEKSYKAMELQSIVSGAEKSIFSIVRA